jgi:predicted ester cyclase
MVTDLDRAAAHRILDAFNLRNPALVDEAVAPAFFDHAVPPGLPPGVESLKRFVGILTEALPDFRFTIELEVTEGDLLVTYGRASGTLTGSLFGSGPTGRRGSWPEVHIFRLADGRVIEHWDVIDQLALRMELGIPLPAGPTAS